MNIVDRMRDVFLDCAEIAEERNKYYATADDPFKNFRRLGDAHVGFGIVTRMGDKMSRIENLICSTMPTPQESLDDSLKDLINYAAILLCWRNRGGE